MWLYYSDEKHLENQPIVLSWSRMNQLTNRHLFFLSCCDKFQRTNCKLCSFFHYPADACFKATIDTIPEISKKLEDRVPLKNLDSIVMEYIKELFSILLVAPVSEEILVNYSVNAKTLSLTIMDIFFNSFRIIQPKAVVCFWFAIWRTRFWGIRGTKIIPRE